MLPNPKYITNIYASLNVKPFDTLLVSDPKPHSFSPFRSTETECHQNPLFGLAEKVGSVDP
ncbi:hypothetical protein LguiA_002056 [Lonicera macranthoides]